MVTITLFSIELEKNVPCSEMPSLPSDSQGFVDIFLSEFSFQNLFWSCSIEHSLRIPQKP